MQFADGKHLKKVEETIYLGGNLRKKTPKLKKEIFRRIADATGVAKNWNSQNYGQMPNVLLVGKSKYIMLLLFQNFYMALKPYN